MQSAHLKRKEYEFSFKAFLCAKTAFTFLQIFFNFFHLQKKIESLRKHKIGEKTKLKSFVFSLPQTSTHRARVNNFLCGLKIEICSKKKMQAAHLKRKEYEFSFKAFLCAKTAFIFLRIFFNFFTYKKN